MKRLIAVAVLALAACTTPPDRGVTMNTDFDPSACTERRFAVYFDDNADLTTEARDSINTVRRRLDGCTIEHVRITGYDEAGHEAEESELVSLERANAVANFLETTTNWPRSVYEVIARGDARSTDEEGADRPMRRRAWVRVTAVPPASPQ